MTGVSWRRPGRALGGVWSAGVVAWGVLFSCLLHLCGGHGRLYEPPGRSTAWRYGFDTPRNDNDHELNCGGFGRQWRINSGRCGICGDAWDTAQPRPNEAGGMYGRGEIVRTYAVGSHIPVGIQLTANHKGFFEFRLCPINSNDVPATQRCLDQNKLQLADGGGVQYFPKPAFNGKIKLRYKLPDGLTCGQCVLQWRYVGGNNWGSCGNGTEGLGCGAQEEFRACADVRIVDEDGVFDETTYDWGDKELGGVVPEGEVALYTETIVAAVLGVLGVVLFFGAVCCYAMMRRSRTGAAGGKKKRAVTFGRQIFLISNPTLTRAGKLVKPGVGRDSPIPPVDASALYEVSSSEGSTNGSSRGTAAPLFAEEGSPDPPVAPKRKKSTKMAPVEAPEQPEQPKPEQEWSQRATPMLQISRPTQVTVNGVSVIPDPTPQR